MDSSSDGSFVWTDASSDTIDSTIMLNDKVKKTHSDNESVSGKSYKKILQDELFALSNGDAEKKPYRKPEDSEERKRKRTECQSSPEQASPKKKKIKTEPESDIDVSSNKHKTNGHNTSESYDESYLDLKVKAEEHFTSPTVSKTKKNKSKTTNADVCNDESSETKSKNASWYQSDIEDHKLDLLVQEEMDQHEKKNKKKKKKSKKKRDSEMYNEYSDSQLEKDAINGSSGSPLLSAEDPEVGLIKNSNKLHYPNDSRDENEASGSQQDLPNVKSAYNRRISERIQFEEDESSDMESSQLQSSKTSSKSSKLKKFLKENVHLKPYNHQMTSESGLTGDDEIWIVRCPREVDIDAFKNKDLVLEGKCKLKLNSQTYEGVVDNESRTMSILSSEQSNFVIKSVPVKGCLNLRKRIPKPHIQDEGLVGNQINFIPLPETKCRHPLFGSNYRKAIKLPTKVSARLQMPCPAPSPASFKKRSHHDKKSYQPNSDSLLSTPKAEPVSEESTVPEMETDQPVSSKKKKKKRKHSESEETAPKKKKRIKHDLESAEAWESEQAIEENLFNF